MEPQKLSTKLKANAGVCQQLGDDGLEHLVEHDNGRRAAPIALATGVSAAASAATLHEPPQTRPSHHHQEPQQQQREPRCAPERESRRCRRILLADDDAVMRHGLAGALCLEGYEVTAARHGVELMDHLMDHLEDGGWHDHGWQEPGASRKPGAAGGVLWRSVDLIITDVRMPGFTGLELLEYLRSTDWLTRVIVISGFVDSEVRNHAERLGASAVVEKPFALDRFLELVRSLVQADHVATQRRLPPQQVWPEGAGVAATHDVS